MANATDLVRKRRGKSRCVVMADSGTQITYIGVPLTVAGVIPLLWNMVVAIQIWLRLRASIPPSLRRYYSLIIDPAAGQVTVVARMPTLSSPGQWITSNPGNDRNSLQKQSAESVSWPTVVVDAMRKITPRPHRQARDHGTSRLASFISTGVLSSFGMPFDILMRSMSQADRLGDITGGVRFGIIRSKLLHRPWMSVIENCNFRMRPSDEMDEDQREEVRFTVQSDMKASDFTPLMMTWAHFVWICLALGVSAYDPLWQSSIPYTIKNGEGKDLIKLFEDNDRLYARLSSGQEVSYVTHRALAWYNIAFNGNILFPLGCGTLSQVPIRSVNISSELSAPYSLQVKAQKARNQALDSVVCGKEPQECEHPLAAACYWMLYRRDLPLGWITVSQRMLEYRERVLCYLKDLDDRKLLLDRLVCLVTAEPHHNDALRPNDENDAVSHLGTTAGPNRLENPETSKEPHVNSVSDESHVLQTFDKGEAAVKMSTQSTDEADTTDHVRSPDSRTDQLSAAVSKRAIATKDAFATVGEERETKSNDDDESAKRRPGSDGNGGSEKQTRLAQSDQTKAHRVLEVLRSHFETSAYVQRYQILAQMGNLLEGPKSRFKSLLKAQTNRNDDYTLAEWARNIPSPLEPSEQSKSKLAEQQAQINAYDLIDPKRRERFEFAVRPYIISPSACNVIAGDEGGFLACVALALADWGGCAHQRWMARPEVVTLAWECEVLAHDMARSLRKPSAVSHKDVYLKVMDLLKNVRGNGLYTAPESPVTHLMRKNDRNVYLL
jgi:hypothetical protein